MLTVHIYEIVISLKISGKPSFDLMLSRAGNVSRMGTGATGVDENVYVGVVAPTMFENVLQGIPVTWPLAFGQYETAQKKGNLCELAVIFLNADHSCKEGFYFRYGSESQGPPREIMRFILAAKTLTEPWYQEQQWLEQQAPMGSPKPSRH